MTTRATGLDPSDSMNSFPPCGKPRLDDGEHRLRLHWALPALLGMAFACGCTPVTYVSPEPRYVQSYPQPAYYPETPPPPQAAPAPAAPDPLDQLMAPVALYPDPLISLLLPASTFPPQIAQAAQYLSQGGDPGQVDLQPWDPSVRSLAHYPTVISWMGANPGWTQAVGAAFASEPAQVMQSIQRLRELAWAAGTLASNPQEQVIVDNSYVEVLPAQPGVIFVPRYDPQIVYVDQPYYGYGGPFITYGQPFQAGVWLTFGCNWRGGGVAIVDQGYWHNARGSWGWSGPEHAQFVASANVRVNVNVTVNVWRFPQGQPRPVAPSGWARNPSVVGVRPMAGAPPHPPQSAFRDIHTKGPAAVAVVSRNPAAFKGRPINPAILKAPAGPAARPASSPVHAAVTPAPRERTAQAVHSANQSAPAGEAARTKPASEPTQARAPAEKPKVEAAPAARKPEPARESTGREEPRGETERAAPRPTPKPTPRPTPKPTPRPAPKPTPSPSQ